MRQVSTWAQPVFGTLHGPFINLYCQISHLDLSTMNPFISFCLYVAARVFVQYLKSRPKDGQVKASLQFLLSAMHAIKRKNPLTESFLVQLDVDLEGAGLDDTNHLRASMQKNRGEPTKSPGCGQPMLGANMDTHTRTYGDSGLAVYNQPNHNSGHTDAQDTSSAMYSFTPNMSQFELPNRQRTPGSINSSGVYQSPSNGYNPEMDTSPDGSGEQQTPGSSAQSQHNPSSQSSYSPRNQQQDHTSGLRMDPSAVAPMLEPGLSAEFPMSAFSSDGIDIQQAGYVLPQAWSGNGSGLTPDQTCPPSDLAT